MNQSDSVSEELMPHTVGERGRLRSDCLAVCAPGSALTVELLFERVLIEAEQNSAQASGVPLTTDQLYDLLIRAETSPIERLLFLSPHTLFSLENPQESFDSQVGLAPIIGEGATNWHLPTKPTLRGSEIVEVFVHSLRPGPGSRTFATYMGQLGTAELLFPPEAFPIEALAVLLALGRTTMEVRLSPPVDVGERRWLRLRIRPTRVLGPVAHNKQGIAEHSSAELSQILDLLGPDTLLASFQDTLDNMSAVGELPHELGDTLTEPAIARGLADLRNYALTNGFQKKGTFTRVEDHRLLLASRNCAIRPISQDGAAKLESIGRLRIEEDDLVSYSWSAGLNQFPVGELVAAAEILYDYVTHYAASVHSAKSKSELTHSCGIEHVLGCELVDEFARLGFFACEYPDRYFLSGHLSLGNHGQTVRKLMVELAQRAAGMRRPVGSHFRIFFEASWRELSQESDKRGRETQHPHERLMKPTGNSETITITPRVFDRPSIPADPKLVSVMMPFSSEFDPIRRAIESACKSEGVKCRRADSIRLHTTFIQDIFDLIFASRIVVVDFSGRNANVMYETGIAHALGKEVIPITQSMDDIPADLRSHRVLKYLPNAEGLRGLTTALAVRIRTIIKGAKGQA